MKKGYLDGIAFGIFTTLFLFLFAGFILDDKSEASEYHDYIQTLMICIVTAATGYLAIRGIREQIQENYRLETERRERSLKASRAALPLSLSQTTRRCREILKAIFQGIPDIENWQNVQFVSDDSLRTFKDCIEYCDEQSGSRLAKIISISQILEARYNQQFIAAPAQRGDLEWGQANHEQLSFAINCATLEALCGSAYGFARGSEDIIPSMINPDDVQGAFFMAHVTWDDYPRLAELYEERARAGTLEINFNRD